MVVNLPLFALGTIWKNEDCVVPVSMVDTFDNDYSGLAASSVSVLYNREGDSVNQVFSPATNQFVSKGRGLYALTFPAAVLNQEGLFEYIVEASGSYKTFRAAGRIERRPESRIFEASASGFNTANSMGEVLNRAGNSVEVFATVSYDSAAQTLTCMIYAQRNGGLVTTATAARITVKDESDVTVFDGTSVSPNADGQFKIVGTTIVLTTKKAYKVRARATIAGVEYSSGEGLQSFS